MKRTLLLAAFLAACDGSTTVPTDTDSDATGETDETDVTVDSKDDTFEFETDWPDSDVETDVDTDMGDTGTERACVFGEAEDCDGRCFPEYMLGDGFCDDRTQFRANFACEELQWDDGDCEIVDDTDGDTDVGPAAPCRFVVEFLTDDWPAEIGWTIRDSSSNIVAQVAAGDYSSPRTFYYHNVVLPDGAYTFIGTDTVGDGWDWDGFEGGWNMFDPNTGHSISDGGTMNNGASRAWPFTIDCDRTGCLLDIVTLPGDDAPQTSWDMYTSADNFVAAAPAGTLTPNTPTTQTVQAYTGDYSLHVRDLGLFGDAGWDGGRVEVRYNEGGMLLASTGLFESDADTIDFNVACDIEDEPAFDAAPPTIELDSCERVGFWMRAGTNGPNQVSYAVYNVDTWEEEYRAFTGTFPNNNAAVSRIDLVDGTYYIEMGDSGGDGWFDGQLSVIPFGLATPVYQTSLPAGANGGSYFTVDCPEPVIDTDPPEETDETDETDVVIIDTDLPECLPGAERDCNNVCYPSSLIGDSTCDDGVNSTANFDCADFSFDGGDCPQ